jgi:hypothetical protein
MFGNTPLREKIASVASPLPLLDADASCVVIGLFDIAILDLLRLQQTGCSSTGPAIEQRFRP